MFSGPAVFAVGQVEGARCHQGADAVFYLGHAVDVDDLEFKPQVDQQVAESAGLGADLEKDEGIFAVEVGENVAERYRRGFGGGIFGFKVRVSSWQNTLLRLPRSIAKIVFMASCSYQNSKKLFVTPQRRSRRGDYNTFASEHLAFIVSLIQDPFNSLKRECR